jgi:hypothetical protein
LLLSLSPANIPSAQEEENTYNLKFYSRFPPRDLAQLPESRRVTFENAEGAEGLSPPSPFLLDCRYRVAEILHAPGMRKPMEDKDGRWRRLKGTSRGREVAENGTTDLAEYVRVGLWQEIMC